MKYIILKYVIFLIVLLKCNIIADTRYLYNKNHFLQNTDELNFGRLSPVPFKYTVSNCSTTSDCGHNLFDGNRNTEWVGVKESDSESVTIDFGSKRLLNSVRWEISPNSTLITEIQIQVLNRNEWKTLSSVMSPALQGIADIISTDASILRINFIKSEGGNLAIRQLSILLNESNLTGISPRFTSYSLPTYGAVIPEDDYYLPGAPRKYRNGVHKGLDFNTYMGADQIEQKMKLTTPILAIASGEIVRVDNDYIPMSLNEYNDITQYNQNHPVTYVDKDFGGRQIWIDHKNGVMSSYNHLSSIVKNIKIGTKVAKGEMIGYAGNSGLISEIKNSKDQIHLHLELWIDGEYLGNDMKPIQIRKFLQYFFTE
jgi:hypothetical protein